ncbi:hypothetical protein EI555_014273, partial [Monodon monoceros]
ILLTTIKHYPSGTNVMVSTNLDRVIIFLTQMKVGILEQIPNQLVLANCLVLFSKGIPQEMTVFGLKYFLVVTGYKLVFYFHRWMEVKIRIPKYTGFCCSSHWILNLLVNVHVAIKVHGLSNTKNVSLGKVYEYCSEPTPDKITSSLLARIIFFIVFLCLMVWASGSMILVLHRHKQQVQHIHSNSLSLRPSHEARATGTIPILVSFFVLLYSLSSILTFCVVLSVNPAQWLVNTSVFVALCFPILSPFVLITHDTRFSKLRFVKIAFFFIGFRFAQLSIIYNMLFTGHKGRPTNSILHQVASARPLIIFSKRIPHTMAAFGLKYFL